MEDNRAKGNPSTLAGVASSMSSKWTGNLVAYDYFEGLLSGVSINQEVWMEYQDYSYESCPAFSNPHEDVLLSLNKLMFYSGYFAATQGGDRQEMTEAYLKAHMDSDLPVNYTTIGSIQAQHNIFNTDYSYFAGAALIEIVCILLILPT